MDDSDLIDVESLDFIDDQVWLHKRPDDSGDHLDIVDWCLSLDWPVYDDSSYNDVEKQLYLLLDEILNNQVLAMPDKHKFDSRTYVKPKRRVQRPSIQQIVEVNSPPTTSPPSSLNTNKYLTYNKYSTPLGPILRHKTFNVDTNTDNSSVIKEYALKRRSLAQDEDPQLEDVDMTLVDMSGRLSSEPAATKPIDIDLSQPANNLYNTFNKGLPNALLSDRGSLTMYQSGESLMRMSPPSLVSSLMMESSGNFNAESLESRKSLASQPSHRDSGLPASGRESMDAMATSMTLSILDEKDMSTSFLSQTTYPDNDSFMDSLPPSLVNSVNSSYVVKPKTDSGRDSAGSNNVFSSTTFTHLEQSERLLTARPRCSNMYNSFTKNPGLRNSESYTKSREEACQIDQTKILSESEDKNESPKPLKPVETVTLHFSNNKFRRNAEKENVDTSFEKDDAFYKEMGMTRTVDLGRNSMNVTLDKQELNEIIQARQKLSLARRGLPDSDRLPNQVETLSKQSLPPSNQTLLLPKKSMENASELLSRRRGFANGHSDALEKDREPPVRNATFRKPSPGRGSMDATVIFVQGEEKNVIDINSATLKLVDGRERTPEEWGSQERAMVGSSESTDTGTFSSSSPPDSVPDTAGSNGHHTHIASTPLTAIRRQGKSDLTSLHSTISPIYNMVDDKSYTVTKADSNNSHGTYDVTSSSHNATVINSATIVKKSSAKRDILAGQVVEKKVLRSPPGRPASSVSQNCMAPPTGLPRKSSLPTSKLRQYSSHRELRIPVANGATTAPPVRPSVGRSLLLRRNVYASNPALSPTSQHAPVRRDSYTIATDEEKPVVKPPVPVLVRQGTETLRRERPQSQLLQPKDLRGLGSSSGGQMRHQALPPPPPRPYSIAGATQLRNTRPNSVPVAKSGSVTAATEIRPASSSDPRMSALPRPTRLPGPRRGLRPPSVYTVAPTTDTDLY